MESQDFHDFFVDPDLVVFESIYDIDEEDLDHVEPNQTQIDLNLESNGQEPPIEPHPIVIDLNTDQEQPVDQSNQTNNAHSNRELTDNEKKMIAQHMLVSQRGKLPWGEQKRIASRWGKSRWTIKRIWETTKLGIQSGHIINVRTKKKGRCGRKAKIFDLERLKAIPIEQRTTVRALAIALGIGHSCVYRLIKSGRIRSHTNSIKPKLSINQKHNRLEFVLSQVIPPTIHTTPRFGLMYNVIHIDEKWFYMSRVTQRFYLFHGVVWDEEEPHRSVQNKNFITKVMFLAAVARPQISNDGEVLWDGKIGVFPFTETHIAIRTTQNRPAGTPQLRAITKVTREVIRDKLINELLPKIREKWPANGVRDIFIQQDNTRPHILGNDPAFNEEATKDGFNIRLVNQPALSPDMNCLDLGFFNAIQSIQYKAFPKSLEELVKAVHDAYEHFEPKILNHTFIQYQQCMLEVLKVRSGNNYKSPHMGKKKLEALGLLPQQLEVPTDLIESTKDFLSQGIIDLNVTPRGLE